jgi:autotransporter-associated beta strand protein
VTKGYFGTGTITFGASVTDRSQFYFTGAATINNAIVVNTAQGDGSQLGAFRLEAGGGLLTIAGTVNANLADVVFEANNNPSMIGTVTGPISGSSGLQVLAQNSGGLVVTLASAANTNSYAGNTIITNSSANVNAYATLTLGAANQIPNGTGKGNLIVMGGSFKMGGFSETINGLSGNGIVDGVSGTPTLTVGDNDATGTTNTFSGVIKNAAGTLSLIKIGSGTLTLSGTNTYSGATAVSNGTLSVNGSLTNANITVAAGATLTGSGTIRCRVSASTNDFIDVSGTATLSGLTLALDVQGLLPTGSYVLAKGLGAAQFKAVTGIPQQATRSATVTYVNGQLVLAVYPKGLMIRVL